MSNQTSADTNAPSKDWLQVFKDFFSKKLKRLATPQGISYAVIGAIAASGAVVTGLEIEFVPSLERQAQSTFFSWRGTIAPPKDIVILAIDDLSLRQGDFYDAKKQILTQNFKYFKKIINDIVTFFHPENPCKIFWSKFLKSFMTLQDL